MQNSTQPVRSIQRALDDEIRACVQIRSDAILFAAPAFIGQEAATAWAGRDVEEKFKELIRHGMLWVCKEVNEIQGWGSQHKNRVDGLYVHPRHMRRRAGEALLYHVEAMLLQQGIETSEMPVSLCALDFYKKHGYREVPGGRFEFSQRMTKQLSAQTLAAGNG